MVARAIQARVSTPKKYQIRSTAPNLPRSPRQDRGEVIVLTRNKVGATSTHNSKSIQNKALNACVFGKAGSANVEVPKSSKALAELHSETKEGIGKGDMDNQTEDRISYLESRIAAMSRKCEMLQSKIDTANTKNRLLRKAARYYCRI